MQASLKQLIKSASEHAEAIFQNTGEFLPMWHAVTANREAIFLMCPEFLEDKDIGVALIRKAFELNDVERYVFISEAWLIDTTKDNYDEARIRRALREGLEHDPDRREVIAFSAENRDGEAQTARRYILRPEHGKPTLAPLMLDEMSRITESSGRMVGLLNKRKA